MSVADHTFDAVVIGLGKTGLSCVRFLKQQGLTVAVTDTRVNPPGRPALQQEYVDVPFFPGDINAALCRRAAQIVVSPGVSLQHPAIKEAIAAGKPVHGDIELFCQQAGAPIVAITGSNGKSTVTTLVAKMAEAANMRIGVGGNLGTPALELLAEPIPEFYILELSSFQLDSTFSLNAYASVVLNISSDHMDRYPDIDHYAASKQRIYYGNGVVIINADDVRVRQMLDPARTCLTFSLNEDVQADFHISRDANETWLCQHDEKIVAESAMGIKGKHNVANALAAMALASVMRVPHAVMKDTLENFSGLPHRCQYVASINGIDWINDSKATNVGACIAAIEGLARPGRIILIAGGDSKGADLAPLLPVLQQHVKHLFLIGIDADRFATLIEHKLSCEMVSGLDEAVNMACQTAQQGDTVLLAPACASLDMFENYQQRGDIFVAAVHALEKA